MKKNRLTSLFESFFSEFATQDAFTSENLILKKEHTIRVCRESCTLAQAEGFSSLETEVLFAAALFHDLSRFEQFSVYKTFNDMQSFDHGDRSYALLLEKDFLKEEFSSEEEQAVLTAVRCHNKLDIPPDLPPLDEKILRAVRDADKVDIMPILINHLKNPVNPAIVYKLSESAPLSGAVRKALRAGRPPSHSVLKSRMDFLAAKFAWGYDLNYPWSCRVFLERRYLQELYDLLPQKDPEIEEIFTDVLTFLQKKGEMKWPKI